MDKEGLIKALKSIVLYLEKESVILEHREGDINTSIYPLSFPGTDGFRYYVTTGRREINISLKLHTYNPKENKLSEINEKL